MVDKCLFIADVLYRNYVAGRVSNEETLRVVTGSDDDEVRMRPGQTVRIVCGIQERAPNSSPTQLHWTGPDGTVPYFPARYVTIFNTWSVCEYGTHSNSSALSVSKT